MKTIFRLALSSILFFTIGVHAQTSKKSPKTTLINEEEELPIMFQFEPNYLVVKSLQRKTLLQKIKALDTLPISEKKRLRLIKALYKDLNSEKVEKAILVHTRFEDKKGVLEN